MASPKLRRRALAAAGVVLVAWACGRADRPAAPAAADLILTGGAVYTMDAARSWADAVAVAGGKIVYVGDAAGAGRYRSASTRVLDLEGRMVLPAFQDSHVHLVTGGMELGLCDLNGLETREAVFARVREYAAAHPERGWVVGGGWALPLFPGGNPSRAELDRLVPDRPACLDAADGHSAWVNSRALAMAGITRETPDPKGGRIERDPATGEPSGTLREAAAGLVERLIPEPSAGDVLEGLRKGMAMANRLGIVSIIEAQADDRILDAYRELDRRNELTVRVLASLAVEPDRDVAQIPSLVERRRIAQGRRLKATAAKIFADGVLEPGTAALLEPYLNRPGDRGPTDVPQDLFDRLAVALDREGFQLHVHAIGDRAVRMTLDAIEAARRANGPRDARPQIVHLELIDPADIVRFRPLGVVADFQALWAYPDAYITDLTLPFLGPARSRWLYPIGSVARTGAVVAGGSDWSVSSMNPLDAVRVGVTRTEPGSEGRPAWIPEERVDLAAMLAAYTINGAFLSGEEGWRGSVEPGKAADLVVIDRNLFDLAPERIDAARVLRTFLDGVEVYAAPEEKRPAGQSSPAPR
jgi:predicted amidohydrolase YtcJ